MATRFKYTAALGASDRGEVAIAAGTAEAQSDTISVNIDLTNMGRREAVNLLEKITAKILAENFPPV